MKYKALKIIISFLLFLIALILDFKFTIILYIISYLLVGLEILLKAGQNILKGKVFDENFLMSIATIGAILIGSWAEAVAVMLFYQIGEFCQEYAVDKSRKSIASLMDIRPDYANREEKENICKVRVEEVKVNDIIIIKPGEKIPLDGLVVEGSSLLDMKALTGEALPQNIGVGENVLSGSLNLNSILKVKVTKEYKDSTVKKILDLVENAHNKKAQSEKFITRFALYYTPMVVFTALFMTIIMPLITNNDFSFWLYKALAFLVVSCPCALVVSIPLSFFGGIGGASKMGVLIKGSNYLENLTKVDTFVFDKTGTLTKGVFSLQQIEAIDIKKEELLKYAAMAEVYSTHPIAQTIKEAYKSKIKLSSIKDVEEIPGCGLKAIINKHEVLVGNAKLMKTNKIKFSLSSEIGTILYVAIDSEYKGYLVIADEIREDASLALEELKQNNIKKIIMLTGDKKEVSLNVAESLSITETFSELLPQDKVRKVEELISKQSKNNKVAFVGDGINDAPVLACADVGIAMGGLGADSAIEAADIVIMTDELNKINKVIKLAHKTMRIVQENIIFALGIKISLLILTIFGISTMWEAVFADVGVLIITVFNALRVLKINQKWQVN